MSSAAGTCAMPEIPELLLNVFSLLDRKSLQSATLVSRHWNAVIASGRSVLRDSRACVASLELLSTGDDSMRIATRKSGSNSNQATYKETEIVANNLFEYIHHLKPKKLSLKLAEDDLKQFINDTPSWWTQSVEALEMQMSGTQKEDRNQLVGKCPNVRCLTVQVPKKDPRRFPWFVLDRVFGSCTNITIRGSDWRVCIDKDFLENIIETTTSGPLKNLVFDGNTCIKVDAEYIANNFFRKLAECFSRRVVKPGWAYSEFSQDDTVKVKLDNVSKPIVDAFRKAIYALGVPVTSCKDFLCQCTVFVFRLHDADVNICIGQTNQAIGIRIRPFRTFFSI